MDTLDQALIYALRHRGRASISELADLLSVSRATVKSRMERLEAENEIIGYSVVLRSDAMEQPVRGIMMMAIEGAGTDRVIGRLNGMSEVRAIHTTNGKWDVIIELGTETLEELDAVLHRIRLLPGVTASETNLLLATKRSARSAPA